MSAAAGLPEWPSVLAVIAHPDDETFGLGAVLSVLVDRGAAVAVLCLTRGEASGIHGVPGDLGEVRAAELAAAADILGVGNVDLLDHPDGRLDQTPLADLVADVSAAVDRVAADGLVVFDPSGVTGHPDHRRATSAALVVADDRSLPVLGWTLPVRVAGTLNAEYGACFAGHPEAEVDLVVTVDRSRQRAAAGCHASQALPTGALWRRLDLLGDAEHLRWLRRRSGRPSQSRGPDGPCG